MVILIILLPDIPICDKRLCDDIQNCRPDGLTPIQCPISMVPIVNEYGKLECECSVGFVYHPTTNKCYKSHTQGPCLDGNVIKVRTNSCCVVVLAQNKPLLIQALP